MGRGNLSISAARPLFEQLEPRVLLDADTVFGPPQDISLSPGAPTCVRTADLDGDGDVDVLSASQWTGKIAWYENLGAGSFSAQKVISTAARGALSVYATDLALLKLPCEPTDPPLPYAQFSGRPVAEGDFLSESPTRGLQPLYDEAGDVLVINSQHVGTQSIDLESNEKTTAAYAARSKGKGSVRQYDVLLNSTGYITIGRWQAMLENVAALVDSHVTILRPKPELDSVYLAMFLNPRPGDDIYGNNALPATARAFGKVTRLCDTDWWIC